MRTTIYFGAPGTGKTQTLLSEVEEALRSGTPPDRIAYFAFTKRAALEAITRACKRFDLDRNAFPWFRTIHSAAFKIMGLKSDEVMSTENYKALGAALGSFTFSFSYDETTERPPQGGGLGDKALFVYSLAAARLRAVEEEWRSISRPDISLPDALRFAAGLNAYKKEYGLLDFNDFLVGEPEPLLLDLLIIDEAQDLTLQQWLFVRAVGRLAKRVLIAGDDDQTIFQWAGADVRSFLSLAGNVVTLPISHRLPRKVWEVVEGVSSKIRVRRAKNWEPRAEPGEVNFLTSPDQAPLRDGKWLLLTRHRYQLDELVNICRDQGVVYSFEGVWSNQTPSIKAVINYERLRADKPVPVEQAQHLRKYIPGLSPIQKTKEPFITWDKIAWPFEGRPDWMSALPGIGTHEREYIRRLRREQASLTDPGKVVLSTIHGVKGGEAENVLVIPDISHKVTMALQDDPDQEARVWYVAASRASKALFVVSPRTRKHFRLG